MMVLKNGRRMISFVTILCSAYVLMCFLLFVFQRKMIYFPTSEVNLPGVTYTILDSGDAAIKVWILNPGREKALIYFGGNAENVGYNIDSFKTLFRNRTVYLVNYRGYGGSSGVPHEQGFYHDALYLYDHVRTQHEALSTMGRSIGAAVSTYLASQRDVDKLILITPFDSAVNVAKKHYWFFPIDLILKERLDTAGRAADITADTLIIAAADDRIIPHRCTLDLIKAFRKTQVEAVILENTGHNTVHLHPDYKKNITSFMR